MAITQTGSEVGFQFNNTANTGTVSTAITVPADAEIIIVGVSGFQGTSDGFESMTFTKGGVDTAMTKVPGGDTNTTWQGTLFYLASPDTGTNKTLKWDWVGTGNSTDGTHCISITFWKGIDTTSPVRDSDGVQSTSLSLSTSSLTAQSGDLIVAWAAMFVSAQDGSGSIDTWSNLTELTEVTHSSFAEGAWATGSPSGNTTVGISAATGASEYSLSALVLKPASTGFTISAESGSFTETGTAATLTYEQVNTLNAASGIFVLTGADAIIEREFSVNSGSYVVTGNTATLTYHIPDPVITAAEGNFSLTGTAATFSRDYEIQTDTGSYTETGIAATFLRDYVFPASSGSYTHTGTAANLEKGYFLSVDSGTYSETGTDATLTYGQGSGYVLEVDSGSYTQTGIDASLEYGREVSATAGSFAFTGTTSSLEKGYKLSVDSTSYTETGTAATFSRTREVQAEVGDYTVTGTDANLAATETFLVDAGSYTWTGISATLERIRSLLAVSGEYSLTGIDVNHLRTYIFPVSSGSFIETGKTGKLRKSPHRNSSGTNPNGIYGSSSVSGTLYENTSGTNPDTVYDTSSISGLMYESTSGENPNDIYEETQF